jgi:hypothetical protein
MTHNTTFIRLEKIPNKNQKPKRLVMVLSIVFYVDIMSIKH